MNEITLKFENNESGNFPYGISVTDLITKTSTDEADVIGVKVNDVQFDLQGSITESGEVSFIKLTDDTPDARALYRHSFSHILAQAVKRINPKAKLAIGPAIKTGFYYDFDVDTPFSSDDLKAITKEMKTIVKQGHKFERMEVSVEEAKKMLSEMDEPYKLELLNDLADKGEAISFYKDGEFLDLCKGPHVPSTKSVRNFKLLSVAGAYWKGDEKNKMLQRIYGTAFLNKEDLKEYTQLLEEAKKRDHRKLGKELDLFSINHEEVGGGLILWHPKGGLVRNLIEEHCKKRHQDGGYDFVYTPHIGRAKLWETSGHLEFYKDGMYPPMEIEGHTYYLKPMNCPFHCHIYKDDIRSYRDLPYRFAEWGTVYRFERSGTLHGLTRVRGFTQDDAHLFCREDQMPAEIDRVLDFSLGLLRDFGLDEFHLYLSTRPEKSVGEDAKWEAAETALRNALERSGIPFSVKEGDGAFYGPKIDICLMDALKREWQLSTIQFDFNLPERFELSYVGEDGKTHRPYMLHRALLGSMERFFAVLLEHHAGIFPVWLAPTQIQVLPIAEAHQEYANKVVEELKSKGLRVKCDSSSNTLSYRVRSAQKQKTPFMIILGDKEVEENKLTVRLRTGENLEIDTFEKTLTFIQDKIENKEVI